MTKELSLKLKIFLLDQEAKVRVDEKDAKQLLLEDSNMIINGTVRYFYINPIGLGV
jgi:hypothetical protein